MKKREIKKNEGLLWFGSWTSKVGNIIFDYANSISIVSAFSNKPWVLALYQSSETIIQILLNLIGGAKADNGQRKKILIITDLIAAVICLILSFLVNTVFMAEVMIIANALLAVVYAFNSPSYKSIIREMIHKERIGFFNSISHGGSEIIRVIGPIISVGLVKFIGVRGALLFDAGTFIISAISEFFLCKIEDSVETIKPKKNVWNDIIEGIVYLTKEKRIFFLLVLSSLVNLFLAGYNLFLPYTNIIFESSLENFYSKALSMEAVGGIIGSILCAKIANKFSDNIKAMIYFLLGTGGVLLFVPILALTGKVFLCLIPFALFGILLTAFNIQFMSYVQIAVAEEYLGRVFSVIFTIAVLFMPIGTFIFSAVFNTNDIRSFYSIGGGIAGLAIISLGIHRTISKNNFSSL